MGRGHVVSEVIERTGQRMLGLEYGGDVDTKALSSYDRRLSARVVKAAAALDELSCCLLSGDVRGQTGSANFTERCRPSDCDSWVDPCRAGPGIVRHSCTIVLLY